MSKKRKSSPSVWSLAISSFDAWRTNFGRVLRQAASINSQPTEESFPELPDVLVWMRAALGLSYGYVLGTKGAKSGALVLQALNLITFVPVVYCRLFLGTSAGTFDMPVLFAGTIPAVALAVLVWIMGYTAAHTSDEQLLASLLLVANASNPAEAMGMDAGGGLGGTGESVGTEF